MYNIIKCVIVFLCADILMSMDTDGYSDSVFKLRVFHTGPIPNGISCTCVNVGNFSGFNLLLTSAHCLIEEIVIPEHIETFNAKPSYSTEYAVQFVLSQGNSSGESFVYSIVADRIILHPKYRSSIYFRGAEEFDIAVIITKQKYFDSHLTFDENVRASGVLHVFDYGLSMNTKNVEIANHVKFPVTATFDYFNTIMVGHHRLEKRRPCNGASGAPLLDNHGRIIGLLSTGTACRHFKLDKDNKTNEIISGLTFFANLSSSSWFVDLYRDFIVQNMSNHDVLAAVVTDAQKWLSQHYSLISDSHKLLHFLVHSLVYEGLSDQTIVLAKFMNAHGYDARVIVDMVVSNMRQRNLTLLCTLIDSLQLHDRDNFVIQTAFLVETHTKLRLMGFELIKKYGLHSVDLVHILLADMGVEKVSELIFKFGYQVHIRSDKEIEVSFGNMTQSRIYMI